MQPLNHHDSLRYLVLGIACVFTLLGCGAGKEQRARPLSGQQPPAKAEDYAADLAVLSATDLQLGNVASAAMSDDGRLVYVGRAASIDRRRLNLVVVSLDEGGRPAGRPRRYADDASPLPAGGHSTATTIVPHPNKLKLYVGTAVAAPPPSQVNSTQLTVYDLDVKGEPTGRPRSYQVIKSSSLVALALHPTGKLLYASGTGGKGLYVQALDQTGEPQGEAKEYAVGSYGKSAIAVSPNGERLYLGTYPSQVEVVELDGAGMPAGAPRTFRAGEEKEYTKFELAKGGAGSTAALYIQRKSAVGSQLAVWSLGPTGDPIGAPRTVPAAPVGALAVDSARGRIWIGATATLEDAFTGKSVPFGVTAGALALTGSARVGVAVDSLQGHVAVKMAASRGGKAVLITQRSLPAPPPNRTRDNRIRVTLLPGTKAVTVPPAGLPVFLQFGTKLEEKALGSLLLSRPSEWLSLDAYLKDRSEQVPVRVVVRGPGVSQVQAQIEVVEGDAKPGGKPLKLLSDTVKGNTVLCLVPGYAFVPSKDFHDRASAIETMSQHADRYLQLARSVALKPDERPRQFSMSAFHLMGGEGHLGQLRAEAAALGSLGFNTVMAYNWGDLPPAEIDAVLRDNGLVGRKLAVYKPPSYFDFDQEKMSPPSLEKWATNEISRVSAGGGSPADLTQFILSDEPNWYYPTMLRELRANRTWLEAFRAELKRKGFHPSDFGASDWNGVAPVGASKATDLPSRRLFYWTMRFFSEAASRGHRLARAALERAAGHRLTVGVNWNNWGNRWYWASPNAKIGNNSVVDLDSAMGSFNWMESGRQQAHTPWTEDWVGDQDAQLWSFYADMLRSSAMAGGGAGGQQEDFGSYVIGRKLGEHPSGGRYKMLSLVGHGAKAIDVYTFGPEVLFGDSWSDHPRTYAAIADGLRMVGRGEKLLFPGRPKRGNVAVLLPGSSALWEQQCTRAPMYLHELWSLHYGLVHGGYTVDFVDESDLADGALSSRDYKTLYITEPNFMRRAYGPVKAWVAAGGTLVLTPGAGTADEYNSPVDVLDSVLGLKSRAPVRTPTVAANLYTAQLVADHVTIANRDFGDGEMQIRGPTTPLETSGASIAAKLRGGGAGITMNAYGQGRAIAFGFFPGWQYWLSPDRTDTSRLPRGWSDAARRLLTAPARIGRTPRTAFASQEGVEVARLDSDKGIALVLLNWIDIPLSSLTITVSGAGKRSRVTSLENGVVPATSTGDVLTVTLPLKDVDVLLVD